MGDVFKPEDVIYRYSLRDAERDGVLVRNTWAGTMISHVTRSVFDLHAPKMGANGYNVTPIVNLIRHAAVIIANTLSRNPQEWLVTGILYQGREYWAALNEENRWTLMLLSDY